MVRSIMGLARLPGAAHARPRVLADASGVTVDDVTYSRDELLAAYARPGTSPTVVLLPLEGPPFEIPVPNEAAGLKLLESIRFVPNSFACSRFVAAPPRAHALTVIVSLVVAWTLGGIFGLPAWWYASPLLLMFGLLIPGLIRIGADGFEIRWLWMRKRIAYAKLSRIASLEGRVMLSLLSGETVDLGGSAQSDVFAKRIRQASQVFAGGSDPQISALLTRRDTSSVREWIWALRAWRESDGGGYRDSGITAERLSRVLVDGQADVRERAAAAAALGAVRETDGQAKLRVVSETVADSKLRDVFHAVMTSDDETLIEAMEGLEKEEAE
jgi:hypothetical protein